MQLRISPPDFSDFQVEKIEAKVLSLLATNQEKIASLTALDNPSWDSFVMPFAKLSNELDEYWAVISHIYAVKQSDELRSVYNAVLPEITHYYSLISKNTKLYEQFLRVSQQTDLTSEQLHYLEHEIRDFKLSGIHLDEEQKQQLTKTSIKLSALSNKFADNILDATQAWKLLITKVEDLSGLPASALNLAKELAVQDNQPGYLINLSYPSYIAVMRYANDRSLREKCYHAYVTKASKYQIGNDNEPLLVEILNTRQELVNKLGFNNYAEYSLATKMAKDTSTVVDFLKELLDKSLPQAQQELQVLTKFAKQHGVENLQPWDIEFFREKYRIANFNLSQDEVREYFPYQQVIQGLFTIANKLYGLHIKEIICSTWHNDVTVYEVLDKQQVVQGYIYFDLFSRNKKREGAWMAECRNRFVIDKKVNIPMAFLNCNFAKGDVLLCHDDVITLFHEFGHALHHILTKIDIYGISGINGVPWDAVELPSQFMENWCWEYESLFLCSKHYKTGEPLPKELFEKMRLTKNYHAALLMLRQLEFALIDFSLHMQENSTIDTVQQIIDSIRKQYSLVNTPIYNKFQNSFSHIFAGGYAAGYYSYKWAEVLASDAFVAFTNEGIFNSKLGDSFKSNILEKGGSKDFMQLYLDFRGKEPTVDALLDQSGIN